MAGLFVLVGLPVNEGDAAEARLLIEDWLEVSGLGPVNEALSKSQVRAANQRAVLVDERIEWAVAQADRAVGLDDGLIPALAQGK